MNDGTILSDAEVIERLTFELRNRAAHTPLRSPNQRRTPAPVVNTPPRPARTVAIACVAAALLLTVAAVVVFGSQSTKNHVVNETPTSLETTTTLDPTIAARAEPRFADFTGCSLADAPGAQYGWICRILSVPVDRSNPSGPTTQLAIYVLPHTDRNSPAKEPLFTAPIFAGYRAFYNPALISLQRPLRAHHDIVTIDPRGTGHSSRIDCKDLQRSNAAPNELKTLIAGCAAQLGSDADKYGAVDRMTDLEHVRQLLGYDTIDFYAPADAATDAQAYAYRYASHLHAIVLDSGGGTLVTDPGSLDYFKVGAPHDMIDIVATQCARDPKCHAQDPNPAATITQLAAQVRAHPIVGEAMAVTGHNVTATIDERTLVSLIMAADSVPLVAAADAARDGDATPMIKLVWSLEPTYQNPDDYSMGTRVAGTCNDIKAPWTLEDPADVRRRKLDAALSALRDDAFAPFSLQAWIDNNPPDFCLTWPTPTRYEPVIPTDATSIKVPTLMLSGNLDRDDLTSRSKLLRQQFATSHFVTVAGADNVTVNTPGTCVADIISRFLETLDPGDTSCA